MARYNLHETFLIHQYKFDEWESEPHNHNYFEIVFVEKGKGFHTINDVRFSYGQGDIFFLAPEDTHFFEIEEKSHFCHFKFTEQLFSGDMNLPDREYWLNKIEHILHHPNLLPGDVILNSEDRARIWNIQQLVVDEYENKKNYYRQIISNCVSTILSIIARNISENYTLNSTNVVESTKIDKILSYIRSNIYNSELLKLQNIADQFNTSPSNISAFFKKQTGESIHQFITYYKLGIIKYRLLNTSYSIAEIAFQLGFTDESHLSRTFKKYVGLSPGAYKKKLNELQR
ncbi:AraC family transcriptional regulator [Sungkyunkwania multivorans]|uniref:AraC family transcriptional regulator n=1 Tax=Sungkyunkwania multivorans TaxID=1173618 RepID=A0ABW3CTU8_9FLAO